MIRLNQLLAIADRSKRLIVFLLRLRDEFLFFVCLEMVFAGNLLITVNLECSNELSVIKYKDISKRFVG